MKNAILGLSFGHHESSVFLFDQKDGKKVFIAEEWVSRVKGDSRFPKFAIQFVKENYPDLFFSIGTVVHFQKPLRNFLGSGMRGSNLDVEHKKLKFRQFHSSDIFVKRDIKKIFGSSCKLIYCDHYYSHILNNVGFLPKISDSFTRVHLILDGYGDGKSGGVYVESIKAGTYSIRKIVELPLQSSLGLLYSALTEWAGFTPNEDEYKVMALASFGNDKFLSSARRICHYDKVAKSIEIQAGYFNFENYNKKTFNENFTNTFGFPDVVDLKPEKLWNSNLCNVILAFQRAIEECVLELLDSILQKNEFINENIQIACGGGVFHNSVLVGKLIKKYGADIFVPPCPGDLGSSIGAVNFGLLSQGKEPLFEMSPFLGPVADDLGSFQNLFECISLGEVMSTSTIMELLERDETIAIYSGRLEIGPRALGARSLICNGDSKSAVEALNEKRKKREPFRPVAPISNKDYLAEIIGPNMKLSLIFNWMGAVIGIADPEGIGNPSCLHHDSTIRVQTLMDKIDQNEPPAYELLEGLLKKFNFVGNTSFNIAGDPMVFQAEDVYINLHRLGLNYVYNHGSLYKTKDVYAISAN